MTSGISYLVLYVMPMGGGVLQDENSLLFKRNGTTPLSCALRSTQPLKMSTRDFSWGMAADAYGLTLVVPNVEMIRGFKLPGTPRATSTCRGTPLLYPRF